ncbi:hypothetical protein JTL70_34515, partial [Pseudomonas aeruginosa]|nr:hypothetical protein [Pseudomonas aeruginosa]
LLLKIDADSPLALLILAFTLMGGGGSLCSSTAQSSAFLHTPAEEMPDASALWNLNRQLSFFAGSALLALLLTAGGLPRPRILKRWARGRLMPESNISPRTPPTPLTLLGCP